MDEFVFAASLLAGIFIGSYALCAAYLTYLLVFDTKPDPTEGGQ